MLNIIRSIIFHNGNTVPLSELSRLAYKSRRLTITIYSESRADFYTFSSAILFYPCQKFIFSKQNMALSQIRAFLLLFTSSLVFLEVSACAGCVQLTEYTFDKVISKFDATLVKFDVAFPYGEKHEAYAELAKDAKSIDELLIAEVGIKDYGERDNEEIAKRFGIKKDDYPVVKLFIKGSKEPLTYPEKKEFTTDNLRHFVKEKSGIHLSLPGCLPQFDKIAFKFMKGKGEERKSLLKKAENAAAGLDDKVFNLFL